MHVFQPRRSNEAAALNSQYFHIGFLLDEVDVDVAVEPSFHASLSFSAMLQLLSASHTPGILMLDVFTEAQNAGQMPPPPLPTARSQRIGSPPPRS